MPWPMRFGPPPSTMIFLLVGRLRTRTLPRRSSTCRRCWSRIRRRRCRRACRPGACSARGASRAPPCRWSSAGAPGGGRRSPSASARAASSLVESVQRLGFQLELDRRRSPRSAPGTSGSILVSVEDFVQREALREGVADVPDAVRAGLAEFLLDHFAVLRSSRSGRRRRLPGRAAPSGTIPGRCGRSPSPRRPTSSAWSGAMSACGNFSKAKRGILVTT